MNKYGNQTGTRDKKQETRDKRQETRERIPPRNIHLIPH